MILEVEQLKEKKEVSASFSASTGAVSVYVYECPNPHNGAFSYVQSPDGLRVRLGRSADDQQLLLAALQGFIRGRLSLDDNGYLSREPCDEDERYDSQFDLLISAQAVYHIVFASHESSVILTGGAGFYPGSFKEGGTIEVVRNASKYPYSPDTSWLPTAKTEPNTVGTLLAHEIGHAFTHVDRLRHADVPANRISRSGYRRLHGVATEWQNTVMGRMNKPLKQ